MPDDMGFVPTDLINRQVNPLIPMAVNDRRLAGSQCSDSQKRDYERLLSTASRSRTTNSKGLFPALRAYFGLIGLLGRRLLG
jgi:hypothetical protein